MAQQRKQDFLQQCSDFFDSADQRCNRDGRVTKLELCKELRERGCGNSPDDIVDWFEELDVDDSGCISKPEFLDALGKVPPEDIDEKRLRAEFRKFDADGSGFITMDELKAACQAIGMQAEEYALDMDTNDDGKVDEQEFLGALKEQARR